ncbi:DUF2382 domain-containing protein [Pantoea sp. BAV 3049]|uniref:DUF2382 domain-containing protein n=1 Tax=Pantoea sp. BAV 3049 TaxID=2654188 RepID=UPI00131B00B7|nr:DUF2382 domain-containing protein [Pantoea sp. BAV 3049]
MAGKNQLPGTQCVSEHSLPVMEEHASISSERIVDNRIRIVRSTASAEQLLETELAREEVSIEHIARNQLVDNDYNAEVRYEGDDLIIPVIEEQVEIIRRKVLKEEIYIRKIQKSEPFQQTVTLRSQEVNISREKTKP